MNLKFLTDEELWNSTIKETELERNSTLKVINYLQEIYSRRLHLKRGYSSLHEFCVSVLKYTDGGAHRRIKAMKLVEELPETKKSLECGSLNLTTASQLQAVIEKQKKSQKPLNQLEKLDLFRRVDGKSQREAEKAFMGICPEVIKRTETQRYVAPDKVKKTLILPERLNDKIERLKELKSHQNKDFIEILEDLIDKELKDIDPLIKTSKNRTQTASAQKLQKTHSRYVRVQDEIEVWKRNNGQCAYIDPLTKKRCQSTHFLQIDHIIPFAKGGPTISENLRLLCSNHNKLEALNHFKVALWPTTGQRRHSTDG